MADCMEKMGVVRESGKWIIGCQGVDKRRFHIGQTLDCGNSGPLLRIVTCNGGRPWALQPQ